MSNGFYNAFDIETLESDRRPADYRTPFQIDRDRILYTSAFRRLQSKTQVFLSGEYDFYRTRLTHSLEVAQIGRSICASLRARDRLLRDDFYIDPDLVEAVCLSHDIGHPPFGHAGERTLHRLMEGYGGFEGNAQTLRLLTETIYSGKGMNPTRAFIDGTLKYKSLLADSPGASRHFLYDSQRAVIDFVLGGASFPDALAPGGPRNGFRSIECQIMDWADDTAYSLHDLIDGAHAGFIRIDALERWAAARTLSTTEAAHLDALVVAIRDERLEAKLGRKIGHFIDAARLVERPPNFLSTASNRYSLALEVGAECRAESLLYQEIARDLVYRTPQLQQLDHKADHVLGGIFGVFEKYYIAAGCGARHIRLLPESTEAAIRMAGETAAANGFPPEAARARLTCDHVAGMTDRFAVRVFKRLFDPDYGSIGDLA